MHEFRLERLVNQGARIVLVHKISAVLLYVLRVPLGDVTINCYQRGVSEKIPRQARYGWVIKILASLNNKEPHMNSRSTDIRNLNNYVFWLGFSVICPSRSA